MSTHVTATEPVPDGIRLTIDDGNGSAITVLRSEPGVITVTIGADGMAATVALPLFAASALVDVLRNVTGADTATPLPGGRNFPKAPR